MTANNISKHTCPRYKHTVDIASITQIEIVHIQVKCGDQGFPSIRDSSLRKEFAPGEVPFIKREPIKDIQCSVM